MRKSCSDLGCRMHTDNFYDALVFNCLDCGKRSVLPKRKDGKWDRTAEHEICKRDIIQPHQYEKWRLLQEHNSVLECGIDGEVVILD